MMFGWLAAGVSTSFAQSPASVQVVNEIRIVELQGTAEISPKGATTWVLTQTNQVLHPFDRLRTGPNSRVALRWSDQSVVPFGALTEIEILTPHAPGAEAGLHLINGILSFFHRDKPGRIRVITRGAVAGIEGTEFVVAVATINNTERTTLSVIDGRVQFGNEQAMLILTNGQQAVAEVGAAPVFTAGFVANNILQWCFYYPAVLDLGDLPLTSEEQAVLRESIDAYRSGDLLTALNEYPAGRQAGSDAERVYHAALLLSVGEVDEAKTTLGRIAAVDASARPQRLATALRQLIAAVMHQADPPITGPQLSTELLAASYYEQSRATGEASLRTALDLAKQAATNSPESGFVWARVAELEFSFGHTAAALDALNKSLTLAPRNAQALALEGFLLAAQNQTHEAIDWFDRAIAVDSALGNAWLGRGLCRIRRGDAAGGREDLLVAAALEPQRAVLRSYLGKAYANESDYLRAAKELQLAKRLDPSDPTAWLYSALLDQQDNRNNEAVRDLEKSQELNDNRSLYRSRFLLDQDRAVRSTDLARLYADTDLGDVAVREASRAVADDYANYSAHLFLASSYETQRRASISDLRFEAPAVSEYQIAALLGPASGRLLAQPVTQLEYSGLLERDGLGLLANTEYFSRGAWRHSSAQYGLFNGSSYSLEAEYFLEPGQRLNQDLEIRQLEAKFKQDVTPDDSVLFHIIDYRAAGGDIAQHFNASEVGPAFRFDEKQTPTILLGFHHQWSPENHTLLLVGRFDDTLKFSDPFSEVLALDLGYGSTNAVVPVVTAHEHQSRVQVYSVEGQQIAMLNKHSLIAGARLQWSDQDIADRVFDPKSFFLIELGTNNPISVQDLKAASFTATVYAYDQWKLADTFQIIAGLDFTHQDIPVDTDSAPVTSERQHQERVSPKVAMIWAPCAATRFRASYTRSLTGSGLGQSLRLEPTAIAGMLQTFRDPIPPALVGGLDGVDVETAEAVWEGHFADTYLSLGYQYLAAKKDRKLGLYLSSFDYDSGPSDGLINDHLDFHQHALDVSAHQLVGKGFSFGARYRLAYDELQSSFPDFDPSLFVADMFGDSSLPQSTRSRAYLHTVSLSGLYRHQCGFFARAEGVWFSQNREQVAVASMGQSGGTAPDDRFWQVNLLAGYRFWQNRTEVAVGLLNATGKDYRLDPLNQYPDLPRSRTFYTRLFINF